MGRVFGIPVSPWDKSKGQWLFGGAIAISLLMHTMVWAALVNHAERQLPDTEETPIMVDLVPPPEQEPPEPQAKLEEPQAQPENQQKPEDTVAELQLPERGTQRVIEFGETDSGPRIDPNGTSQRESSEQEPGEKESGEPEQDEPEQNEPEQKEQEQAEPSAQEAEEMQDADNGAPKVLEDGPIETSNAEEAPEQEPSKQEEVPEKEPPVQETPVQEPPEQKQSLPKPETNEVADTEVAPDGSDAETTVVTLVTPKPRPARKRVAARRNTAASARRKTGSSGKLIRATRLFSRQASGDPRVQTAMRGIPRSDRMNRLCRTEMEGQLLAASPPRFPDFLPWFPQARGTVLQPRQVAFRSRGQWFNYAFRCEVDKAATKVLKFSYRIGSRIPPTDWARRGLTKF